MFHVPLLVVVGVVAGLRRLEAERELPVIVGCPHPAIEVLEKAKCEVAQTDHARDHPLW